MDPSSGRPSTGAGASTGATTPSESIPMSDLSRGGSGTASATDGGGTATTSFIIPPSPGGGAHGGGGDAAGGPPTRTRGDPNRSLMASFWDSPRENSLVLLRRGWWNIKGFWNGGWINKCAIGTVGLLIVGLLFWLLYSLLFAGGTGHSGTSTPGPTLNGTMPGDVPDYTTPGDAADRLTNEPTVSTATSAEPDDGIGVEDSTTEESPKDVSTEESPKDVTTPESIIPPIEGPFDFDKREEQYKKYLASIMGGPNDPPPADQPDHIPGSSITIDDGHIKEQPKDQEPSDPAKMQRSARSVEWPPKASELEKEQWYKRQNAWSVYQRMLKKGFKPNANPCDNFYEYVCGNSHDRFNMIDYTMFELQDLLQDVFEWLNGTDINAPKWAYWPKDQYWRCINTNDTGNLTQFLWNKTCAFDTFSDHTLVVLRLYVYWASRLYTVPENMEKAAINEIRDMMINIQKSAVDLVLSKNFPYETAKVMVEKIGYAKIFIGYPDWLMDDSLNWLLGSIYPRTYENFSLDYRERRQELNDFVNERIVNMTTSDPNSFSEFPHFIAWRQARTTLNIGNENAVIFPIHEILFPMYHRDLPLAVNYGSEGVVLAHELVHSLDYFGSFWDAFGKTRVSGKRFLWDDGRENPMSLLASCLQRLYANIHIVDRVVVNTSRSMNEFISDTVGIKIAYEAFRKLWNDTAMYGKSPQNKFGKTYDDSFFWNVTNEKMFFVSYAKRFCKMPMSHLDLQQYKNSTHVPPYIRVNRVLCNFPKFAEAFNCPRAGRWDQNQNYPFDWHYTEAPWMATCGRVPPNYGQYVETCQLL